MFRYVGSFWIFISNYLSCLFGFITRYHGVKSNKKIVDAYQAQDDEKFSSTISEESKLDHEKENSIFGVELWEVEGSDRKGHDEETKRESSVIVETITACSSNNNKYCFMNQNHVCGFMEVPKSMNFTIHEVFSDDDFKLKNSTVHYDHLISEKGFETEDFTDEIKIGGPEDGIQKLESKSLIAYELFTGSNEDSLGKITNDDDDDDSTDKDFETEDCTDEKIEDVTENHPELETRIYVIDERNEDSGETSDYSDEKTSNFDEKTGFTERDHFDKPEIPLFSFKFVLSSKSLNDKKLIENGETGSSNDDETVQNMIDELVQNRVKFGADHEIDSTEDEVERNTVDPVQIIFTYENDDQLDQNGPEIPCLIESHLSETAISDSDDESFIELEPETGFFNERVFAHLNFGKLDEKQETMNNSEKSHEPNLHQEESETEDDDSDEPQAPNLHREESNTKNGDSNSEKPYEPNSHEEESETIDDALHDEESDLSDSDDEMEHVDYINKLKQELKYVNNRELPTIMEDLEFPKMLEDLKPLKIDTKMEHKERIHEIQKVYKIYADKMRKLDILSYQTMHSIDLLKLKINPTQSNTSRKSSLSLLKSLLSLKPSNTRNNGENTTEESIKELKKDYELVYTGQICISWEILHWQHEKAKELQRYDPYGFKQYNQVAAEFQQFQVLLQRFIENEPFQETPRIHNYIANRSVFRSFLQVPSIKDDSMKDKKARQDEKYMINIAMLTSIISESMRLFFEFNRSGKEDYSISSRDAKGAFDILEDHVNSELFIDVLEIFQKKEKRVKELLRSRSCICKKFRKNQDEEKLDQSLLNAQVELKLVEKVINMSKLTREQLIWCHTKLEDINFLSRKICLEPSNFLLFLPF